MRAAHYVDDFTRLNERLAMMNFIRKQSSCALTRLAIALAMLAALPAAQSWAGPVILSTDGSVAYDQPTGGLSIQANGLFYLSDFLPGGNPQVPITSDSATLNLTVDASGKLIGTGTLAVNGAIDFDQDGANDVSGVLLTGTITAFASAGASPPPWDFHGGVTVDGGLLTQPSIALSGGGAFNDLFQLGQFSSFNLEVEQRVSGILGDFAASFSGNTVKGVVITGVPEPSTLTLGLIALVPVALCARRRGWDRRKCV
jgi:hypothetical protein